MTGAADMELIIRAKVDDAIRGLTSLKTQLGATGSAGDKLNNSFKAINTSTFAVRNAGIEFSHVLRDIPFAIQSQNASLLLGPIDRLVQSFTSAQAAGGSFKSVMAGIAGSFAGPAGILLAVSAAGTLFSLFQDKLFASSKTVDEATKANEDYVKSLESINHQAVETSQKEIAGLQTLVNVARDSAASYQKRIDAVTKLQEQFPAYFGNLSKETILYGNITDAVNKTTEALINQALAQAASNKAGEAGARVYDLTLKRQTAVQELLSAQNKLNEAEKHGIPSGPQFVAVDKAKKDLNTVTDLLHEAQLEQAKFTGDAQKYSVLSVGIKTAGDAFTQVSTILRKLTEDIDDINKKAAATGGDFKTDKISAYKKAIEDLLKIPIDTTQIKTLQASIEALLKAGVGKDSDIIKGIQDQIQKLDPASGQVSKLSQVFKDLGGSFDDSGKKAKDSIDKISEVLSKLKEAREKLANNDLILNVDKPKKDINLLFDALQKLKDLKAPDPIIIKLQAEAFPVIQSQLKQEFGKLPDIAPPPIKIPVVIDFPKVDADFFQLKGKVEFLAKQLKVTLPVNFEAMNPEEMKKIAKQLEGTQSGFDNILKINLNLKNFDELEAKAEHIAATFNDVLGPSFTAAFDALANGKNVFDAIGGSLRQMVTKMAAALAEAAALTLVISLVTGQPVNFGSLFSQLAGLPKFDQGGIVTDNLVGILHKNEAVIPLDRLGDYMTAPENSMHLTGDFKLSGSDLILALTRADKQRGRATGLRLF